jgi:hypothetical protein
MERIRILGSIEAAKIAVTMVGPPWLARYSQSSYQYQKQYAFGVHKGWMPNGSKLRDRPNDSLQLNPRPEFHSLLTGKPSYCYRNDEE